MKMLLLSISLFLLVSSPVYALIVTDNVDRDNFQYEVGYQFATNDLGRADGTRNVSVQPQSTNRILYFTVPRDGRLVGMSVAGNAACTAGAATFDVTINGTITGVQTVIEPTVTTARSAVGISGSAGTTYAYIRQDRADTVAARGFRMDWDRFGKYDSDHPYGKATALSAGNRVGVQVTTSSGFAPNTTTDYVVVIYVLH